MSARKPARKLITTAEAARIWRVKPSTYRAYVARGQAPAPVWPNMHDEHEVREARKLRPGAGARTDRW